MCVPPLQVSGQGRYLLEVRIRRYNNPTRIRGVDEQCCDPNVEESSHSGCQNSCDNSFEFCFRPLDSPTTRSLDLIDENCPLGIFATGFVTARDPDELEYTKRFVGVIGSAPNPLPIQGDATWPVSR